MDRTEGDFTEIILGKKVGGDLFITIQFSQKKLAQNYIFHSIQDNIFTLVDDLGMKVNFKAYLELVEESHD